MSSNDTDPFAPNIIPKPVHLALTGGTYRFGPSIVIVATGAATVEAELLAARLTRAAQAPIPVVDHATTGASAIEMKLDATLARLGDEGYRLVVEADRIGIRAATAAGLFYGTQTLLQLLPPDVLSETPDTATSAWKIPCLEIEDYPRFVWRGAMLDVSRHFFAPEYLAKFIDVLALHKINVLHLHLTDDQGWRLEIKKFPKLTGVGAFREETLVGLLSSSPAHAGFDPKAQKFDRIPHGGYYTQDQMRDLVAYAAKRHMTIVPEIEMPGHAQAAIAAYPELGCADERLSVSTCWGVHANIFNPSEATLHFLQDVLEEVMDIFPSRFIHVGGDEAVKTQWKSSAVCQARMKALGLRDEDAMQSYFIGRMAEVIDARGRRLLGWDEILEGGLSENATVMSWRGETGGITAAEAGHDVVMAPYQSTYFDFRQARDVAAEPIAMDGFIDLEKAYSYEPIPRTLSPEFHRHVLGAQGQLWTEYIPTTSHLEYMAFPRLAALAEVVWSREDKDYHDFLARLKLHLERLQALKINYRPMDRIA